MSHTFSAQFQEQFNQSPPEQKLATLQHELTLSLIKVSGWNDVLQHANLTHTSKLPDDLSAWLVGLNNAVDELKEILELLRNSNPRPAGDYQE